MRGARPRILVLITLAEVGGAQTYVASLLPTLAAEYDVTVAAFGPGPVVAAAAAAAATYVPLRNVRRELGWRDALGLLELYRLCRRVRPDVVHANSSKAGVLGRLAAALAGVPVRIFTVHGWAFKADRGLASRLYLLADRAVRPLTTAIVCVAESERREGLRARTCVADRTVVIPNAIDVAAAPVAPLAGDPPVVVTVGRFKAPKDFATLLEALALLPRGSFRARVVGDGPERATIEALRKRLGLGDAVELLGERDDVPALLAAADVFVLSTRSEGMPMSILEALAAGLPVVASAVGGIPELLSDDVGELVPPGDARALERALRRLLDDPELRRERGRRARARAEERHDLAAFRAAHLELYRRELARIP